jgi:hypothetical protein
LKAALGNVKPTPKVREQKLQHVSDTREKIRQDLAKKWKDKRYEVKHYKIVFYVVTINELFDDA